MRTSLRYGLGLFAVSAALLACGELSAEEAREALDEASISSAAASLTAGSIDISTHFTIGGAVENVASDIRDFVHTQLPCARVTLVGARLTIEYGALPGICIYQGQTYAGTHVIDVMASSASQVMVEHTWTGLSNQTVSVTGSAMVTWNAADATRHASYSTTWTRASDGHTGTGTGDVTQSALSGGVLLGFAESGERTWRSAAGTWSLDIDRVQMRWIDPCPQSGTYTLTTPSSRHLTLSFTRTVPMTIRATIASGARSYDIDVRTL